MLSITVETHTCTHIVPVSAKHLAGSHCCQIKSLWRNIWVIHHNNCETDPRSNAVYLYLFPNFLTQLLPLLVWVDHVLTFHIMHFLHTSYKEMHRQKGQCILVKRIDTTGRAVSSGAWTFCVFCMSLYIVLLLFCVLPALWVSLSQWEWGSRP